MGSVGDCYDKPMCESFFATLESGLLDRRSFRNHAEAPRASDKVAGKPLAMRWA